jgi:hypothetical protein
VLTANVEKRLAALKSSTQINGFQHLFLLPPFSAANSYGDGVIKNSRLSSLRKPPRFTFD